jgi:hypothetical protein
MWYVVNLSQLHYSKRGGLIGRAPPAPGLIESGRASHQQDLNWHLANAGTAANHLQRQAMCCHLPAIFGTKCDETSGSGYLQPDHEPGYREMPIGHPRNGLDLTPRI